MRLKWVLGKAITNGDFRYSIVEFLWQQVFANGDSNWIGNECKLDGDRHNVVLGLRNDIVSEKQGRK